MESTADEKFVFFLQSELFENDIMGEIISKRNAALANKSP